MKVLIDKKFLLFFILFNLLLMHKFLLSILFKGTIDYEYIMGSWKVAQYFFNYFDEFAKRAFIGTIFNVFNIIVTHKSIVIISIFTTNIFFILFYFFANIAFRDTEKRYFMMFIILFLFSPGTILHLGIDLGRNDHFMLLVFIISLLILHFKNDKYFILIPFLLIVGLLIHEIFLFFYAPIIIAVIFFEYKSNNINFKYLILSVLTIFITLVCLYLYGKADEVLINDIKQNVLLVTGNNYDPSSSLKVWSRSVNDNLFMTLKEALTQDWKILHFIITMPLTISMIYMLFRVINLSKNLNKSMKLLIASLFCMLPMYFLGTDFARWTALLLTNIFILFLYLKINLRIDFMKIEFELKDKIILIFILLHSFLGPLRIGGSYDYAIEILVKIKNLIL